MAVQHRKEPLARRRKTDARVRDGLKATPDLTIETHQIAIEIEQWSAGVSGIDCRVRLNDVAARPLVAVQRADDA